jgi:hypothetical protein
MADRQSEIEELERQALELNRRRHILEYEECRERLESAVKRWHWRMWPKRLTAGGRRNRTRPTCNAERQGEKPPWPYMRPALLGVRVRTRGITVRNYLSARLHAPEGHATLLQRLVLAAMEEPRCN